MLVFENPYVPPPAGLPTASLVLGQEQMTTQDINHLGPSASSLSSPTAVTTDGTRLLISDTGNNRVLVYLALPTGSYQAADLVLGQTNFTNVAQAAKVELSFVHQLTIVLTLMLTSKGVAGVPRASLVILLGTATSFGLPVEPIFIILGIDELMDMARTSVNVIGNCLATTVIAKWEGELQTQKLEA